MRPWWPDSAAFAYSQQSSRNIHLSYLCNRLINCGSSFLCILEIFLKIQLVPPTFWGDIKEELEKDLVIWEEWRRSPKLYYCLISIVSTISWWPCLFLRLFHSKHSLSGFLYFFEISRFSRPPTQSKMLRIITIFVALAAVSSLLIAVSSGRSWYDCLWELKRKLGW